MKLNGRVGQVVGPFTQNIDLLNDDQPIGVFTPESSRPNLFKLGIQAEAGTRIKVNGKQIKIGKTGIYELDGVVNINSLIFMDATDADTIVDFCY